MRYAMKREVASLVKDRRTVFPWSMSDLKPGEKVCAMDFLTSERPNAFRWGVLRVKRLL